MFPEGSYGVLGKSEHCRNCRFSLPQNVLAQSRSAGFSHGSKTLFYSLPLAKWSCDTEVGVTWVQRSWGEGEDTGGNHSLKFCSNGSRVGKMTVRNEGRPCVAHCDDTSKKARKRSSCHKQNKPNKSKKGKITEKKGGLVDVSLRTFLGSNNFLPFREPQHFHYSVTVFVLV